MIQSHPAHANKHHQLTNRHINQLGNKKGGMKGLHQCDDQQKTMVFTTAIMDNQLVFWRLQKWDLFPENEISKTLWVKFSMGHRK